MNPRLFPKNNLDTINRNYMMSIIRQEGGREGAIDYGMKLENKVQKKYYTELRKCFKCIIPKKEKELSHLLKEIESCVGCAKS